MPFDLFNFPLVIRRQIPQEMSLIDVLNFSFCSSKAEKLARKSIRKGYSSMIHSCSNLSVKHSYLIQINDISNSRVDLSFSIREASRETIMKQGKWFELKVGQSKVYCATSHEDNIIYFYFNGSTSKAVHQMLQKIIMNLHQTPPKSDIVIIWRKEMSRQNMDSFSSIENVNHISLARISQQDSIPITYLDQTFSTWPDLKSMSLYAQMDGNIKDDCGLLTIEKLYIRHSKSLADTLIPRFKGRYLRVLGAFISTDQIINWLHQWITGENFQNIQTMSFYLAPGYQLNVETIYQAVDANSWDPATRPKEYYNEANQEKPINCEEWLDISSSGQLASIFIEPNSFKFVKWQY